MVCCNMVLSILSGISDLIYVQWCTSLENVYIWYQYIKHNTYTNSIFCTTNTEPHHLSIKQIVIIKWYRKKVFAWSAVEGTSKFACWIFLYRAGKHSALPQTITVQAWGSNQQPASNNANVVNMIKKKSGVLCTSTTEHNSQHLCNVLAPILT